MEGEARRKKIVEYLEKTDGPISAATLAGKFGISRQIIVGDVALLRASGYAITATPRGYLLDREPQEFPYTGIVAVKHDEPETREELYTIVDYGGVCIDVTVEHAVYGELTGSLNVASRLDADEFCAKLERGEARNLSRLTDGVHIHHIGCPSREIFEKIRTALKEKGICIE